jgi:fructokinase
MAFPKVVVLGDACVDMVIRLPDYTSKTPDLKDSIPQLHGGGSAANVAVALARLDTPVKLMGTVGDDGYGRWVRDDLEQEGVDVQGLNSVREAFTPMVMALIEPNGERLAVVWPPQGGAHFKLRTNSINHKVITSSSWLHVTGICLRESPAREAVLNSMERVRGLNLKVSLDLNLRKELWGLDKTIQETFERAIEYSDVIFGNAKEEIIPITGSDSVEAAAQSLCGGKRIVVARQGKHGVLVTTAKASFHVPAFQTFVVDTLGAGDAFNGGFIAACLAKVDLREAARWGNAVAAFKVGQTGARGLPFLKDIKQLLEEN